MSKVVHISFGSALIQLIIGLKIFLNQSRTNRGSLTLVLLRFALAA